MGKDKEKEEGKITFRPGQNGMIEAVKDGKVVGYVQEGGFTHPGEKRGKEKK